MYVRIHKYCTHTHTHRERERERDSTFRVTERSSSSENILKSVMVPMVRLYTYTTGGDGGDWNVLQTPEGQNISLDRGRLEEHKTHQATDKRRTTPKLPTT